MRRICEVLDINPASLYNKLSYLDHVATDFAEHQELKLINPGNFAKRAYVSVDRQDHALNWGTQLDRRNIMLGEDGKTVIAPGHRFTICHFETAHGRDHIEKCSDVLLGHVMPCHGP